jgi:hypothetical protein
MALSVFRRALPRMGSRSAPTGYRVPVAHVLLCSGFIAAGLAAVLRPAGVAKAMIDARVSSIRRTSLLNQHRVDREVRVFDNPSSLALQVWIVRGIGTAMVVGGVIGIVS